MHGQSLGNLRDTFTPLPVLPPANLFSRPAAKRCPRHVRVSVTSQRADHALTSTSKCPFAGVPDNIQVTLPTQDASGQQWAHLSGPGWKVLADGNDNGLPQPDGRWCWNPVLGDTLGFLTHGAAPFLLERYRQFGPVFTWMLGRDKMVTVVDYDIVKSLLQLGDGKIMRGWGPEAMYAMLGEGARNNLENPANRVVSRKLLAPGFTREALSGYMDKLEAICDLQLDAWAASGQPVDLVTEGKALSFEFSTQLLVDFEVPGEQKADIKRKLDALFQGMFSPPLNIPFTPFARGLQAKSQLQQDIIHIIKNSTSSTKRDKAKSDDSSKNSKGKGGSVFQSMLAARRQLQGPDGSLSDEQMADAGIGLIIAGNDTSGLGLTALLAVLPLFPDAVEKLRQEQHQVILKHGAGLTPAALDSMQYADAVVKEVLRVLPPSTQVMRKTLVDLEICGRFVPAGSVLYLSTYLGQVLTDPHLDLGSLSSQDLQVLQHNWQLLGIDNLKSQFKPERWLQQQQQQQHQQQHQHQHQANEPAATSSTSSSSSSSAALSRPSGLLTFSAGPHVCLGLSLYMTEAKVLLAKLARGYTLDIATDQAHLAFKSTFVTQIASKSKVQFRKLQLCESAA